MSEELQAQLRESWNRNAAAWTSAVRGRAIPSRDAGTDAAVLHACRASLAELASSRSESTRVLDVGCGEGWLARALAADGIEVHGVDGSAALVEAARDGAPETARFEVASYERLVEDDECARGPWELAVCNFALLGDPVAPLLRALARRLSSRGRLIIQTVHPWVAAGDGEYRDAWREERFATFRTPFPAAMPWFSRTLSSWVGAVRSAGLDLLAVEEPLDPETARPLSLLLVCARSH